MANFLNRYQYLNFLTIFLIAAAVLYGCATIQQPTGGPKDVTPPKIVRESPANLTKNFSAKKVEIEFDEYFKLANESKEISVSPAMEKAPVFKIKKKILEITFQDSLEKNTTYTINFGKGLVDYNEGNILKNYSYVFATGNVIDSLSISGTVTNAVTGKPELEATVFVIPISQDSIFGKKRASLFTTTDSSGNFSLKHLRENTYRIYALKEDGGDRIYNSTNEPIAFLKDSIKLSKDTSKITLKTFKEDVSVFKVLERKLYSDGHFLFAYNMPLSNPSLKILSPAELDPKKQIDFNATGDSVLMWLPEITYDSIKVVPLNKGIPLDTVTLRRNKKDTYTNTLTITDNAGSSSKIRQRADLILTLSAPAATFDQSKITLLEDSIPKKFTMQKDTGSIRSYMLTYPWRLKKTYTLKIAENAFTSISGGKNKVYSRPFTMDPDENYSQITLDITPPDTSKSFVLQLTQNDKPIKTTSFKGPKKINYSGMAPGKYTVQVIYDDNKNGKWDTGNVKAKRQPERIWNYPTELTLRTNLDIEEKLKIPAD